MERPILKLRSVKENRLQLIFICHVIPVKRAYAPKKREPVL